MRRYFKNEVKSRMLSESEELWIKEQYTKHLARMNDIAKQLLVSRQCVWKCLKRQGVDTRKAVRITRECNTCGKLIERRRGMARKTKYSYCSDKCYMAHLETLGEDYRPSAYHCRIGRKIVAQYHTWLPGQVIHHINKDDEDNQLKNLEVYANQSDHLRKHRGQDIKPVWNGIDYI